MLLNVENFNIDMFLRFEDKNIHIYYSDFETIPELSEYIPLGSFDDDDRFPLVKLNYNDRIKVGLLFMERDSFSLRDPLTINILIKLDAFYNEFINIPEVTNFCKDYINLCDDANPPEWCMDCSIPETECPSYCGGTDMCSINVPLTEFYNTDYNPILNPEEYYKDIYFLVVVYFNGIYRTSPDSAMNYAVYDTLTDIDFGMNRYSMIINIKEFFTKEFIYFLKTPPGSLVFGNDFGTDIKKVIQTKNLEVQKINIQNEIDFFIIHFNEVYGDFVSIRDVNIIQKFSDIGGDSWGVHIFATVAKERLTYRIIL